MLKPFNCICGRLGSSGTFGSSSFFFFTLIWSEYVLWVFSHLIDCLGTNIATLIRFQLVQFTFTLHSVKGSKPFEKPCLAALHQKPRKEVTWKNLDKCLSANVNKIERRLAKLLETFLLLALDFALVAFNQNFQRYRPLPAVYVQQIQPSKFLQSSQAANIHISLGLHKCSSNPS